MVIIQLLSILGKEMKNMGFKPLPIGIDNFQEIIEQGYYYVDKTALIKELLEMRGKVNLFTRPRRFGKTLNLSMLQCFFEEGYCDAEQLFQDLYIMKQDKHRCTRGTNKIKKKC